MRSQDGSVRSIAGRVIFALTQRYAGRRLSPSVLDKFKRDFIAAMKEKGFDWHALKDEISFDFSANGDVNLIMPEQHLNTFH